MRTFQKGWTRCYNNCSISLLHEYVQRTRAAIPSLCFWMITPPLNPVALFESLSLSSLSCLPESRALRIAHVFSVPASPPGVRRRPRLVAVLPLRATVALGSGLHGHPRRQRAPYRGLRRLTWRGIAWVRRGKRLAQCSRPACMAASRYRSSGCEVLHSEHLASERGGE